jgi:hypothetical protein
MTLITLISGVSPQRTQRTQRIEETDAPVPGRLISVISAGADIMRSNVDSPGGWSGLLKMFAAKAEQMN